MNGVRQRGAPEFGLTSFLRPARAPTLDAVSMNALPSVDLDAGTPRNFREPLELVLDEPPELLRAGAAGVITAGEHEFAHFRIFQRALDLALRRGNDGRGRLHRRQPAHPPGIHAEAGYGLGDGRNLRHLA